MKNNKTDLHQSKIVKKVISFKHKNKEFIYESLGHSNHEPDLNRYALLAGVKKEEIKEFKVKIFHFDRDMENHFSSWFAKQDQIHPYSSSKKEIKVNKAVKKNETNRCYSSKSNNKYSKTTQ